MFNDRITKVAFFISLSGHLFLLGMPGFNPPSFQVEKPEEITVRIEIEKPPLLPKIDIMGEEKKLANSKSRIANGELEEMINDKQLAISDMQLIDPAQEAMLRYQDMVKQKIEEARRYPLWAKRQGIEGAVCLNFTVLSNGLCQDIKIIRSSGSCVLDEEALATVDRASPFPAMPKEINSSLVYMEVTIVFALNDYEK